MNNMLLTTVKSFNVVNSRIITLKLDIKWVIIVFVNVRAPTEDKDKNEKDLFYSSLDSTHCETPRGCVQEIVGD